jgi:predicted RNA-binding protein with PUA-like domain
MKGTDKKEIKLRVGMVVNRVLKSFAKPMKLTDIKSNTNLKGITLIKQPRLSVMPIKENYWQMIIYIDDTSI